MNTNRLSNWLDSICRPVSTNFWVSDSVIYNSSIHDAVDLTECFEDTAVFYSIALCFWLLGFLRLLCSAVDRPGIPHSYINSCKKMLCLSAIVPAVADLGYTCIKAAEDKDSVAHYQFMSPLVLIITMIFAIFVIYYERRIGIRSSSLMTLFWLLLVIYGGIKLRTLILRHLDGIPLDIFRVCVFCFELFVFMIQFVLVLKPEQKSPYNIFTSEERDPCPEQFAPFFSQITWWWQNGLFWSGYFHPLSHSDLCDLNYTDRSYTVERIFQQHWKKELDFRKSGNRLRSCGGRRKPSLLVALTLSFGFTYFIGSLFRACKDLLGFVSPLLLKSLINYISDPNEESWRGYLYTAVLFTAAVLQSICSHRFYHSSYITSMRIRAAVIGAVYKKALVLSNSARRTNSVGEIVNILSVDVQRLMDCMYSLHMVWSSPFQIVLALVFLYQTMGVSIFAGFIFMVLLIPINSIIASISKKYQVKQMAKKDSRTRIINDVLNGIKVIKLYAWEVPYKTMLERIRKQELSLLRICAYLNALSAFTWTCAPFFVALATFTTYSLLNHNDPGNRLTAEKAFVALSLFNILRFPLQLLPLVITLIIQANVALKRLGKFLQNTEIDPNAVTQIEEPAQDGEESVSIANGTFTWEDVDRPCLKDIEFSVKSGELVAVVGQVGAGKSSLISALLGDMEKINGDVTMRGRVAYVPQQAWIQNATVKDNILFGKPLSGMLYDQTLHACALEQDLEILPGGDMTEIGEKGINLSGGQKQRVSLARSVYQEADVYLLDDPLSAVDSHVGKHIFDKVIGPDGVLKGKTRILVTHGLGFLSQCDKIIVIVDGKISEVGTYSQLIQRDEAFAEYLRNYDTDEVSEQRSENVVGANRMKAPHTVQTTGVGINDDDDVDDYMNVVIRPPRSSINAHSPRPHGGHIIVDSKISERSSLIVKERVGSGSIKMSVFLTYAKACKYLMALLVFVFGLLACGTDIGQNFWLAHWSNQATVTPNKSNIVTDLSVYAGLGTGQSFFYLMELFILAQAAIFGSRGLHNGMLTAILRSPMSFFDTTPIGRILNRFSRDIYTIDELIPRSLIYFVYMFFSVFSTLVVISIASPWFLVIAVPLMIVYMVIQRFYIVTSRQLKRLDNVSCSPIFSHFQESIVGASSIRAYKQSDRFIESSRQNVDHNHIAYYPTVCGYRWLAMRLEFIGNLIVLSASLFAVLQRNYSHVFGRISPGLAGLSVTYALQITIALNLLVRRISDIESDIVAVERVKEYSEVVSEAADINPNNRPPPNWPIEGRVQFDRYSTRYREELSLVLKGITACISGGEKVGIVGRTGAGKSSLTLALFRIIESARGAILIDGIDIATIGLRDLRSRITIIPQDPVLFSGTLRINLDPFDHHSDDEIWSALQTAHLSQFVNGLEAGLEHEISEGGENISVGQRQLVCLARALLRKTKILVLDEATAAVDMETDDLIQKTIRKEFANATVITIAHRLNTIMDYDKVMVLDNGYVSEFDSPNKLLEQKGVFYGMARDAHIV